MRRRRRRRRRRRWKVSTTHKKAYTIRRRNSIMQIPRSDCFFTLFVSPHRNGINQFLSSLTAAAAAAAEKLVILPFYSNFCVFDLNFRHFFLSFYRSWMTSRLRRRRLYGRASCAPSKPRCRGRVCGTENSMSCWVRQSGPRAKNFRQKKRNKNLVHLVDG